MSAGFESNAAEEPVVQGSFKTRSANCQRRRRALTAHLLDKVKVGLRGDGVAIGDVDALGGQCLLCFEAAGPDVSCGRDRASASRGRRKASASGEQDEGDRKWSRAIAAAARQVGSPSHWPHLVHFAEGRVLAADGRHILNVDLLEPLDVGGRGVAAHGRRHKKKRVEESPKGGRKGVWREKRESRKM